MLCPKCHLQLRITKSSIKDGVVKQEFSCVNKQCQNYMKVVEEKESSLTPVVKNK